MTGTPDPAPEEPGENNPPAPEIIDPEPATPDPEPDDEDAA